MSKRYEGVPELADYGLDLATLEKMYRDWAERGIPKSAIERRYIGSAHHHGKLFSRLVREHLGHETEREHPLRTKVVALQREIERLRGLLKDHGIIDPPADGGVVLGQGNLLEERERDL